jgi:uncharacterized repeat protein (TIGR03803 family)
MTSAMMTRIKNLTSAIALLALTVVAATPTYAQTYSVLSNFGTKSGDALVPETGLIAQGRDGSLYSTANAGGANNWGAVFKVTPAGKEIVLYSFCSVADCADGNSPVGGLTLRPDGHFLGTTTYNGPGVGNGAGTVFDANRHPHYTPHLHRDRGGWSAVSANPGTVRKFLWSDAVWRKQRELRHFVQNPRKRIQRTALFRRSERLQPYRSAGSGN